MTTAVMYLSQEDPTADGGTSTAGILSPADFLQVLQVVRNNAQVLEEQVAALEQERQARALGDAAVGGESATDSELSQEVEDRIAGDNAEAQARASAIGQAVADLLDNAPTAFDTLGKLAAVLTDTKTKLDNFADSGDVDFDQLSEVVAGIQQLMASVDGLTIDSIFGLRPALDAEAEARAAGLAEAVETNRLRRRWWLSELSQYTGSATARAKLAINDLDALGGGILMVDQNLIITDSEWLDLAGKQGVSVKAAFPLVSTITLDPSATNNNQWFRFTSGTSNCELAGFLIDATAATSGLVHGAYVDGYKNKIRSCEFTGPDQEVLFAATGTLLGGYLVSVRAASVGAEIVKCKFFGATHQVVLAQGDVDTEIKQCEFSGYSQRAVYAKAADGAAGTKVRRCKFGLPANIPSDSAAKQPLAFSTGSNAAHFRSDVEVIDNRFYFSGQGYSASSLISDQSVADACSLHRVDGFTVSGNKFVGCGEVAITVSMGTRNGSIYDNRTNGSDTAGVGVGRDGLTGIDRCQNITVRDNDLRHPCRDTHHDHLSPLSCIAANCCDGLYVTGNTIIDDDEGTGDEQMSHALKFNDCTDVFEANNTISGYTVKRLLNEGSTFKRLEADYEFDTVGDLPVLVADHQQRTAVLVAGSWHDPMPTGWLARA